MDQERRLITAQSLQTLFDSTNTSLTIVRNVAEFSAHKLDEGDVSDVEDIDTRDPAIVAIDVASQVSYLRKLKHQYLEQNAKDKYVKLIVTDIDDPPTVTDGDNKQLEKQNMEQKEKLKVAKEKLSTIEEEFRVVSSKVEEDYIRVKQATAKATELAQKIIDARLALSRLRQTHPHPRVTVQTADKKLEDQVMEMQALTDEMQVVEQKVHSVKGKLKSESLEMESLKSQRNEVEKSVKKSESGFNDDRRFVPLYDWLTGSLMIHRSMQGLEVMEAISENELRLQYGVEDKHGRSRSISITLIFVPNSRKLAAANANVQGMEEFAIDFSDIIEAHLQMNNIRGMLAAILARTREGT
ncbi:hypothetical protein F5879DRAFT_946801 [Lentinula edodes]|uniref:uncharacterized protein n=1 Tax=Lentinula edodes TaxID=5353 RepID=UPI001E8D7D66|nr:uncharacterized protein C8R40DRAFT_1057116 [Lentinula edodes]KAH7870401.1 hypothetical protein C8R40DRAFT_1057116 [Lentinula edodes]KAJ3906323.1 hypothetical protein F5879DRAFT_946801 [Lentinula edodes]KAJ3919682.1 hypothetical protein F5877DRAFT_39665 [Lentinula edodes]